MLRLVKYLNLFSIDVVLGAMCSASMASYLLKVEMPLYWWFCLAATIWIIYIGDHLIDSLSLKVPVGERRVFIHRHFKKLAVLVIVLAVIIAFVSFIFLSAQIIQFGFVLGIVTGLYLLMVYIFGQRNLIGLQKELYVSSIYTAGVWGSALLTTEIVLNYEVILIIIAFFLLVFSSILIFSIYDHKNDETHQFVSLIGLVGLKTVSCLSVFSLAASGLLSVYLCFFAEQKNMWVAIILLVMAFCLFLIYWFKQKFSVNDYYRYFGEAVFFLPALVQLL